MMKAKLPLVYGMIVSMFSEVFATEPGASLKFFRKVEGDPHLTARCMLHKEDLVYHAEHPVSELGFTGTEIEAEIANQMVVTMVMEIKKQVEKAKREEAVKAEAKSAEKEEDVESTYSNINQGFIDEDRRPVWAENFSEREYEYLVHVVTGLIANGPVDSVLVQSCVEGGKRIFHIYEPFAALNNMSFVAPSVASIVFGRDSRMEFLVGDDNGIGMLSSDLKLHLVSSLPRNNMPEIDFWHFVDAIGSWMLQGASDA